MARCEHQTLKGKRCKNQTIIGNACRVHLRMTIRRVMKKVARKRGLL